MPRFVIDWFLYWKDNPLELKLNDDWTLKLNGTEFHPKIQIERKNCSRKGFVSGKLELFVSLKHDGLYQGIFVMEISESLYINQRLANIGPYKMHRIRKNMKYKLKGHVDITENCNEFPIEIEDESSEESYQPKSQENRKFNNEIFQKSLEKLSFDFEGLLDPNTSTLSDVMLKCGNATIPAHKIILSARSPVFAAMFANPMKESIKNEVDISDLDLNTIQALLLYVYTGKISDFTDTSDADLLVAADKYQLKELKIICADFLKDTISLRNVLRVLVLGDLIHEDLKSFAMDYICNNSADFSALENTEEWKTLQKKNPALSMEILTSMVKCMNEKLKI